MNYSAAFCRQRGKCAGGVSAIIYLTCTIAICSERHQVDGAKGIVVRGDEWGSESEPASCIPLEFGSILDHENQRDTEENRQRGSV